MTTATRRTALAGLCGAAALLFAVATSACASKATTRTTAPGTKPQTGVASWYGPKFHGRTTANGERYNMMDLTAAHKTLPFGTYVMVTKKSTKNGIVVRINDRGPFVQGRIIDLSYAAAKVIGASTSGVISVELRIMDRAQGEALHDAQKKLIAETGLRPWTDSDYRRLGSRTSS